MIDWKNQPLGTKMGRASAFDANAPFPLPAAGTVLTTIDTTDVHENDVVVLLAYREYTLALEANPTENNPVTFTYSPFLLVSEYDSATQRLLLIDYAFNRSFWVPASEIAPENIFPAETLPTILELNGRSRI